MRSSMRGSRVEREGQASTHVASAASGVGVAAAVGAAMASGPTRGEENTGREMLSY